MAFSYNPVLVATKSSESYGHIPKSDTRSCYGELWDKWGEMMDRFWTSYCAVGSGWDCWSIGLFDCVLCTPSQQAQESWHKQILR